MKLRVFLRNVVGKKRYYPSDMISSNILWLMGRKSFTKKQLEYCEKMGWTIEYTAEE